MPATPRRPIPQSKTREANAPGSVRRPVSEAASAETAPAYDTVPGDYEWEIRRLDAAMAAALQD